MSIFDSIIETIKPLSDAYKEIDTAVEGVVGNSLSSLVRDYTRGTNDILTQKRAVAKAKAEQLKPQLQKINVQAGNTRYGLENYASDPAAIEQRWQSILTSFLTPNATKGK